MDKLVKKYLSEATFRDIRSDNRQPRNRAIDKYSKAKDDFHDSFISLIGSIEELEDILGTTPELEKIDAMIDEVWDKVTDETQRLYVFLQKEKKKE